VHGTALLVTALVVGGVLAGLVLAGRRGHLLAASVVALVSLSVAWVLAKLASDAEYRDADGWVDCWPSCSPLQHAVGISLWVAPLVALLVICSTILAFAIRRSRRRGPRG
jgi:hypothetical protein